MELNRKENEKIYGDDDENDVVDDGVSHTQNRNGNIHKLYEAAAEADGEEM